MQPSSPTVVALRTVSQRLLRLPACFRFESIIAVYRGVFSRTTPAHLLAYGTRTSGAANRKVSAWGGVVRSSFRRGLGSDKVGGFSHLTRVVSRSFLFRAEKADSLHSGSCSECGGGTTVNTGARTGCECLTFQAAVSTELEEFI